MLHGQRQVHLLHAGWELHELHLSERPKIRFTHLPEFLRPPAPITPGDFVREMAREAVTDLLIFGYHLAPDGTEYFAEDIPLPE